MRTCCRSRPKPRPSPAVLGRIEQHRDELATAAPAWHEMLFGGHRLAPGRARAEIERSLEEAIRARIPILPYDAAAATWHAAERARLVPLVRTPPFVDGQIASIAQTNNLVLVTFNVADFAAMAEVAV